LSTAFSAGEQNWRARLGKLRDVVRQEVVARQLDRELPPAPVRIIDLGCGQGTQALRLARRGSEVTGPDDAEPPPDLPALLACEERAGHTDPYRQVAALLHLVARSARDGAAW
jgi:2-polyprenyl-3-methyl-5-hydroxy-6-metoxy-1,4-benzoquinol methylase